MPQLPLTGRQSAANLPQRLGPTQLAEQHGDELSPTAESARMPFGFMFTGCCVNPVREMSCKICEKMLHPRFKAEPSCDSLVFANSTYQRLSAFFFPKAINKAELIWTRLDFYLDAGWRSLTASDSERALVGGRVSPEAFLVLEWGWWYGFGRIQTKFVTA
jgi:hypothetical protein